MDQTQTKPLIQRVHEFFRELTELGQFDKMSGLSDLTHPDEINSLCDAVAAAAAKSEPRLYTLQMWGCVEPNLFGPYATEEERVADTKNIRADDNSSEEDSYCRINVDQDGTPSVSCFVSGELDDDDSDSEEE